MDVANRCVLYCFVLGCRTKDRSTMEPGGGYRFLLFGVCVCVSNASAHIGATYCYFGLDLSWLEFLDLLTPTAAASKGVSSAPNSLRRLGKEGDSPGIRGLPGAPTGFDDLARMACSR